MPDIHLTDQAQARAGKEYRICVSDTPAGLAGQVTDLLSQGWELYGHPFVNSPNYGNGNGNKTDTNCFCQAMVKIPGYAAPIVDSPAAVIASPQPPKPTKAQAHPVAPVRTRPARPRVTPTFRNVAAFLAVIAGGYLLVECLIFRSGFYARFLEPESSTGSFERTFKSERDRKPSGKKEVLVLGNSRIAEGFSARVANEYKPGDGYVFLNSGVPSATDRAFYYLVRDLDPHRDRYAAIAIPIDDYDDPDDLEDVADRVSDMRLVINRLRFTDIIPYTLSFTSWKSRREVFRSTLFKGTAYQLDMQDFIEHPTQRLARVKDFREHGEAWFYDYGGIDKTLAGLTVDYAARKATFPPGMPADQQHYLEEAFFNRPKQYGRMRDFEIRWLGPLADLYRGSKTRIIIFEAPRGPAPRPADHIKDPAVDELRKRPWVIVLDKTAFEGLEKPELFGDQVHLNSAGRKLFSPMFADAVKAALH